MEPDNNEHKIILLCNRHGVVIKIFLDTASLLTDIKLPIGLHSIVSSASIPILGSFWQSIQEKSIKEDIQLTLTYDSENFSYVFSGYLLNDKVLICGNTEMTEKGKAYQEMVLINNEQVNQVRLTEKKVRNMLEEFEEKEMNEAALNDFSSLNNELVNNKRELVRKNRKIEVLNEELRAASENMKMFTHSVSHDLREPLRMIKSFLTLLNRKYGDELDEKGKMYVAMATDGANRLSKMFEDLLEYHKASKFNINETVDLNDVFHEVQEILKRKIEDRSAQVNCEKLPVISGSFVGYRQVFQNLISNAIKFVPEGKTPTVSVEVEEGEKYYTMAVRDNGVGIPVDKQQDIFNLFERLHSSEQFEGTGMGLAMTRKSIERMGGTIWLESAPGKGTNFFFTIVK